MDYKKRITIDQNVMTGKPVIAGTRVPVELVLKKLALNIEPETILKEYPRLTRKDIQAAVLYALERVKGEKVYLLET